MEYEQLKEERRGRINARDNLVYATLGVVSMTVVGAVETGRAVNGFRARRCSRRRTG